MDTAITAIPSSAITSSESGQSVSLDLPSAQQWQVNQQDAAAFEQALHGNHVYSHNVFDPSGQLNSAPTSIDKATDSSSLANEVLNKMQAMSTSAAEKGEALERHIMKATDSLNPMDIVQANRMMSEYYLENMMTAKLVGNATKAVERLTSLN